MTAYAIPPVTSEAIATSDYRFGITDAMLLYSSVPEAPPPAYSSGTTYALGGLASMGAAGDEITVWRSKQDGNTGHPLVEGDWWTVAGTTYAEWSPSVAYAQGHYVLRTTNHQVYRRVTAGTTSQPPEEDAESVNWSLVGTTNRWAMFDMLSGAATRAIGPVVIRLAPGRISALALLGVSDGNATFRLEADGEEVWAPDPYPLDRTPINSWEDYWFAPFDTVGNIVRLDVPTYASGVLTITIEAGSDFTLQWLVVGTAQALGDTKWDPQIEDESGAIAERNKFNELQRIRRLGDVTSISQTMLIDKPLIRRAREALRVARSCPCVFTGLENQEDDYAELLTQLAINVASRITPKNTVEAEISLKTESV